MQFCIKCEFCDEAIEFLDIAKDPAYTREFSLDNAKIEILALTELYASQANKNMESAILGIKRLTVNVVKGKYGDDVSVSEITKRFSSCLEMGNKPQKNDELSK